MSPRPRFSEGCLLNHHPTRQEMCPLLLRGVHSVRKEARLCVISEGSDGETRGRKRGP